MKLKHFAAASLCVAAGAFSTSAMADTVVYNITPVSYSLTDLMNTLSIQQFDPSLGMLTGIEIDYTTKVTGDVTLVNATSKDKKVTVSLSAVATLTAPGSLSASDNGALVTAVPTTALKNTPGGVMVQNGSQELHTSLSLTSSDSQFGLFQGTGSVAGGLFVATTTKATGPAGFTGIFSSHNQGLGTVTYTFTAAPVPEPETYAMLLLGMGVVAFAAKRKSQA